MKNPRSHTLRPGGVGEVGGTRMLRGLMLCMKNIFSFFLMFSKYLWRYSCIMKSTGSVVTYLVFEFLIPPCYIYSYTCAIVHSAHCVWKFTVIFPWILRGLTVLLGVPAKYNYEAPRGEGGERLSRGLSGAPGRGISEPSPLPPPRPLLFPRGPPTL